MSAAAFSTLQTRYLDALGYTRLVLAGATDQAVKANTQDPSMAIAPSESKLLSPSTRSRAGSGLPTNTNVRRDPKLLEAILRAAGGPAHALADPQVWLQGLGVSTLDALRADPSAKRALWIRLRAERRVR